MSSAAINIFSAEFMNAPLATLGAAISLAAFFLAISRALNRIFHYKKGHHRILKEAGVPASILNIFLISIPLKKLPSVGWAEKIIIFIFILLFAGSVWYLVPALIQAIKAPDGSALLVWKDSGETFYLSSHQALDARTFALPRWTVTAADCLQHRAEMTQVNVSTQRHFNDLCNLLTRPESREYIRQSVDKFQKDRLFIYVMIPLIEVVLAWIISGFIFIYHYTRKVRRYILSEQKKAIEYACGELPDNKIYAIYRELD